MVVDVISMSRNHIIFWFQCADEDVKSLGTGIDGFPSSGDKWKTRRLIQSLTPTDGTSWLCFGDFKSLLGPDENYGGDLPDLTQIAQFHNTITEVCLSDL